MHVSLVGISHKDAPVAVREHLAFSEEQLPEVLRRLAEQYPGAVALSTCNRTEIYLASPRGIGDARPVVALLGDVKGEAQLEGLPFATLAGRDAARHLFRVAAGIDSMVVGESEILGQVRGAFAAATAAGTNAPALSRLFHAAIRVGRKARAETAIGRGAISLSSTAVALAREVFGDLAGRPALVVGSGAAGRLAARALAVAGATVTVTSRNTDHAANLAAEIEGAVVPFERLEDAIAESDIILTSTAAPGVVLGRELVERATSRRIARPLVMIDIAVPRDIAPDVATLPGVRLFDIDDLHGIAAANASLRRSEVKRVEVMVDAEADRYAEWLRALVVVPTVASLRARAERTRRTELERTLARTSMSDEDRRRVDAMTAALVKKLLHDPIARLKTPGDGGAYVESVRALFALDEEGQ